MTGREKLQAALSSGATTQVPAVVCYERIFIRDHWQQLTASPWWHWYSPKVEHLARWWGDATRPTGQDWFRLSACCSRHDQIRPPSCRAERRGDLAHELGGL